ncbi:helix-turn-helix domain-containing protein [Flavitalea antarctica]
MFRLTIPYHAGEKITVTGESSSEVCYEAGFESLSYFNKLFKKLTGENPSPLKKDFSFET